MTECEDSENDRINTEIEHHIKILSQNPTDKESWRYLAYTARRTERSCDRIVRAIQHIIDLHPDSWETYFVQADLLIIYGHFKAGLEKYEGRFMHSSYASALHLYRQGLKHRFTTPGGLPDFLTGASKVKSSSTSGITSKTWQGENLAGKTLLIFSEGGLGDSIHFLRYIPILKQYGCKVFLHLQEPLHCLFRHLDAQIITKKLRIPKPDFHVFMMSLPYCCKTDLSNIPPPVKIPCTLSPVKGRIGVIWQGNPENSNDNYRSLCLAQLEPLFKIPGFTYVSLQQKVSKDQDKRLESYAVERPSLDSFTDTVRVLERCELVICVDTSVAHLAASMGIPTWILIPYIADWRWLIHRNDSPWYPSVTLFRQNRLNSWDEPILNITRSLQHVN
jgi:hypothetical protein